MLTKEEIVTGYTEREVSFGALTTTRRDSDRAARSLAERKKRLEARVELAKRAKGIIDDKNYKKQLAAAEAGIAAAQKEFDKANEPFLRLEAAKAGINNAGAVRNGVESAHKMELLKLHREGLALEDFLWSDVTDALQHALDEAFRSKGSSSEKAREVLKAAMKTAADLPYRFQGSWQRWEKILASLMKVAHSHGTDLDGSEKWDDFDFGGPTEVDASGR